MPKINSSNEARAEQPVVFQSNATPCSPSAPSFFENSSIGPSSSTSAAAQTSSTSNASPFIVFPNATPCSPSAPSLNTSSASAANTPTFFSKIMTSMIKMIKIICKIPKVVARVIGAVIRFIFNVFLAIANMFLGLVKRMLNLKANAKEKLERKRRGEENFTPYNHLPLNPKPNSTESNRI